MARNVKNVSTALSRTYKPVPSITLTSVRAGDALENMVAALGTQRDKRSHTAYTMAKILTRWDLDCMYQGSWLSKRIVNMLPNGVTKKWRKFVFADEDNNPNIETLQLAEKKFDVKTKFNEAIRWARLYGAGFIVIGTKDVRGSGDMSKPLDTTKIRKDDLRYLHVVDRWRLAPSGEMDTDLESTNFGKPLTYVLAESSVKIHWTRLIRFDGEKIPYFAWMQNGMFHDSVLRHVYESVVNYDTSTSAIASMLFEANVDVVQSEGLTELLSTKDGESKLVKRFQLSGMMKSFNRMLLLDSNETYEKKSNTYSGIDKIWDQFMTDVSGAANIPKSILFGDQGSGLQSGGEDDQSNWYDQISAYQNDEVDSKLSYFDDIFVRSQLGAMPDNYSSKWEILGQTDESEQADIDFKNAQRDQIYVGLGAVTEGLVASELKARGTYRSMSNEDVALAEELGEKMDEFQDAQRDQTLNPPENQPDKEGADA